MHPTSGVSPTASSVSVYKTDDDSSVFVTPLQTPTASTYGEHAGRSSGAFDDFDDDEDNGGTPVAVARYREAASVRAENNNAPDRGLDRGPERVPEQQTAIEQGPEQHTAPERGPELQTGPDAPSHPPSANALDQSRFEDAEVKSLVESERTSGTVTPTERHGTTSLAPNAHIVAVVPAAPIAGAGLVAPTNLSEDHANDTAATATTTAAPAAAAAAASEGQPGPPSADDDTLRAKEAIADESADDMVYPSGGILAVITFGLCMATFVVALDNTIIATAIPKITTVFDSLGDVGWYGSSYLLTTTSLQPTFGKIYTYFNIKWTYLIALCIFEVGSIICATAVNSVMLIVGRAIAGAGASALFSGGMTIIGFTVPIHRRPIYIALLSSMFGISSVIGPLIGGVFTDRLTWRWCFWINLPFGGIALFIVFFFFKNPKRAHVDLTLKQKIGQMDLLGAFFLICGIVCLLLALQWGGSTYLWRSPRVWGCILGFVLIIIIFIALQFYRGDSATIPPRIMTQRTVAAGSAFTSFLSMGLYTHIYYLPFYFQAVKGTTAEGSGIRTIPYLVSITLASIAIGGSITSFGWYVPFMWIGAIIFTIGCGMLYTLQVGDGAAKWIGYQLLAGIGAGSSVQIPFISVQVVLSAKDMPTGNALTIFFNSLGGALAISIAQNIFSNSLLTELKRLVPSISPSVIINAGATHIREVTPPALLPAVLEAYDIAITRAYIVPIATGGIAFLCSLAMEWRTVKGKKLGVGGAA